MIAAMICPLPGRTVQLQPGQPVIPAPVDMAAMSTRAKVSRRLRSGVTVRLVYKGKRGGAERVISVAPQRADSVADGARVFVELVGEAELKLCVVRPPPEIASPRFKVGSRAGR
jgi:hypothetical protein